jgi:short-subunit dehydrogenase
MTTKKACPILVTGASTGIGAHLTRYLAERDHPVYATARKDEDLENLAQIENVSPIRLDVRDPKQIQAAYGKIAKQGLGLYGLVNNAGIGGLGMFNTWTDEEMFEIFDVNVFGLHRMTNAFVRLLIESHGRIVNIGSQGGMITSKYFGPYTMTKFALEAYTEALYQELVSYDVQVSIVQPGGIVSEVGANAMPGNMARFQRAEVPFDEEARQVLGNFSQSPPEANDDAPESETNRKPSSPEIVSVAVYDALFSDHPKTHYLVGTVWEGDRVITGMLAKLLEENDNPQHNYSREELIALLDVQIKQRNSK